MMEISSGRSVSLQSGHQPRFLTGLDANKSSAPGIGDTYYATDTKRTYICYVAGTWYNNNVLRGVLGVASGWGTAPTNLANCTDGDFTTSTGTGSKVLGAAGVVGELVFDLQSSKTLLVGIKAGIWASVGSIQILVYSSEDNITIFLIRNAAATEIFEGVNASLVSYLA